MLSLKNSVNGPTDDHNQASSLSLSLPKETTNSNNNITSTGHYDKRENRMDIGLFLAAKSDDAATLRNTLERVSTQKNMPHSEIVGEVSLIGNTLLHLCMVYGNKEGAAYIANHFPTLVMRQNSHGDTAMHLAARAGDINMVKTLFHIRIRDNQKRPDMSVTRSNSGNIQINFSPSSEQIRDPFVLLLRQRNMEGNMPLHESLIHGHMELARVLINYDDPDVLPLVNDQEESPLYLAARAGEASLVKYILDRDTNENVDGRLKGKSAVHAALLKRNQSVLEILLDGEPKFISLRDKEGRTPVHLAASLGYVKELRYLLGINVDSAFEKDNNGLLPIHLACMKGHIRLVRLLLEYWPEPCELLSSKGQNILHVAVASGRRFMVWCILRRAGCEKLINMRDNDGNTPLHLAAMSWHPTIVISLTWGKGMDLKLVNSQGKTALDCAEYNMETAPSYRMWPTVAALLSGGVRRAYSNSIPPSTALQRSKQSYPSKMKNYKTRANTLLLVATLVATITFAAGFTMPGGYINSGQDQGMAIMLKSRWFQLFVISDTIAMYSSITVAVTLIWAHIGDVNLMLYAFKLAVPLLGLSLSMMSLSFVAGIYLVVSHLRWLAITVLVIGFMFISSLTPLFFIWFCQTVASITSL